MNSQLWWYTARSGGIVAWALLAASMIWGLAMSTKATVGGRRPRPNWMLDLHRFLGGAALVFVGIHVAAIVLDSYVDFGLTDVLVPFASSWNPAAVAWGIVGLYLLVAVEVTSLLRKKLSRRVWRITHTLSFPTFVLTTVHMLTAGTDSSTLALRLATAGATVVIGSLTAWRIMQLDQPPPAARVPVRPDRRGARAPIATAPVPAPPNPGLEPVVEPGVEPVVVADLREPTAAPLAPSTLDAAHHPDPGATPGEVGEPTQRIPSVL